MTDAVIVSTARTPIGKAYRGAFNNTHGAVLGGHVIKHTVERAGVEAGEVEDVIMGVGMPEGAAGHKHRTPMRNSGRPAGHHGGRHGQPVLQFRAADHRDGRPARHRRQGAGDGRRRHGFDLAGAERTSEQLPRPRRLDSMRTSPDLYMAMIDTAEVVAERYGIGREAQDAYAVESQARTAAGQEAGRFDDEIVSLASVKIVTDKATGETSEQTVTLAKDEGNRPGTAIDALAGLPPVRGEGHCITAGNASQLSDGASACVVMDAKLAEQRGLDPLGVFRGFTVAGCEPDEMGIGPVFAVPRLLERNRADGRRHRPYGSSTRRSPSRCSIAASVSAFRPTSSTSTAARSRSAIPTACRARGSPVTR